MPRKKIKTRNSSKPNSFGKIASLTTKSIGKAFTNYKKNKELQKIRLIKLQKLEEKNQISKEKKDVDHVNFNVRFPGYWSFYTQCIIFQHFAISLSILHFFETSYNLQVLFYLTNLIEVCFIVNFLRKFLI